MGSMKRFPGYSPPEEKGAESSFNAEATKERIFGEHVKDYMESMQEEDPQKYESHFAKYIEAGIGADSIEDMYTEAHEAIRKDPAFKPNGKEKYKPEIRGNKIVLKDGNTVNRSRKLNKKARKARVAAKMVRHFAALEEEE